MFKPTFTALSLALLFGAGIATAAAPAILISPDGKMTQVLLTDATDKQLSYKKNETTTAVDKLDRSKVQSIYFVEPEIFTKALRAFKMANFDDALIQFQDCKEQFKGTDTVPGNYSTLAAFYEMECFRLSGKTAELKAAKEKFLSAPLVREEFLEQVDLYAAWLAAGDESWERLIRLAEEFKEKTQINSHQAQMAYLVGLGYDKSGQVDQALDNYALAMVADYGASSNVVKMAYENSLALLKADPEVQTAMKVYGTPDERAGSLGHRKLLQAGSLVKLYELNFGQKDPIKDEFKVFEKYAKS